VYWSVGLAPEAGRCGRLQATRGQSCCCFWSPTHAKDIACAKRYRTALLLAGVAVMQRPHICGKCLADQQFQVPRDCRFFIFVAILLIMHQLGVAMFRTFGALCRSDTVANTFGESSYYHHTLAARGVLVLWRLADAMRRHGCAGAHPSAAPRRRCAC